MLVHNQCGKGNAADDVANGAKDSIDDVVSNGARHTEDQQTVIKLAKEAKKNGGSTLDDANTLLEWASEYNVPAHGPEIHPNRSGVNSNVLHYHIGKTGHIPIIKK